jgi:para-nitrobenzyl esterase
MIETTLGDISGFEMQGTHAFLGIPYAAPPVPPHRFMPPRPMTPWAGVRQATRYGDQARQILFPFLDPALDNDPKYDATRDYHRGIDAKGMPYSEDCLSLNVWTPGISGKRPVLVWLHGGGFASGAGSWGWSSGETMAAAQDVVVVTLNHRLNIFGFLCLDRDGYAPNVGMLDIIAALEWVRDNIAAFGGDPANVTIFGQSGGGMKVSTLMAMPAARGLFHKAIVQSGPFLRAIPRDRADEIAARMLARLGVQRHNLAALQTISPEALLDAFASVREGAPGVPRQFGPVIDGDSLPADPFEPIASPLAADVPMLIGATSEEVTSLIGFNDPSIYTITDADLADRLAAYFAFPKSVVEPAIAAYRAARPGHSASRLFAAIASDWRFGFGSTLQAERQSVQAPVYAYLLSWQSPVQGGVMGAAHNLCMPLVFGKHKAPGVTGDGPAHFALADAVQVAWASFARSGNPNHPGLPAWPRYDAATRQTMRLDSVCQVEANPHAAERAAQAALPPRP